MIVRIEFIFIYMYIINIICVMVESLDIIVIVDFYCNKIVWLVFLFVCESY